MINEKELLQWLEKRITSIPSPLTFKWYTKKGYAEWVAAHNIIISFGDSGQKIYVKLNNTWREYSKVYVKVNGAWVEQSNWSTVFNTNTKYVHKSN